MFSVELSSITCGKEMSSRKKSS